LFKKFQSPFLLKKDFTEITFFDLNVLSLNTAYCKKGIILSDVSHEAPWWRVDTALKSLTTMGEGGEGGQYWCAGEGVKRNLFGSGGRLGRKSTGLLHTLSTPPIYF
jgi:hypothetical protein